MTYSLANLDLLARSDIKDEFGRSLKDHNNGRTKVEIANKISFPYSHPTAWTLKAGVVELACSVIVITFLVGLQILKIKKKKGQYQIFLFNEIHYQILEGKAPANYKPCQNRH